jgi:integrase|tara:strand:+ start:1020 stop:2024 length:1005 start_codon:yes stop_codon:yes gene_type:complete
MATYRKRKGKWTVAIRKKNYPPVYKTFIEKSSANKWAKQVESDMDKQIFEDYTSAHNTMLKQLLERYREELTIKKKGARSETYRLNLLMRNKIAQVNLMQLKSSHIYTLKTELTEQGLKPQTVKHYIHLLSVIWNTAKRVWGIRMPLESPFALVVLDKVQNERTRVLTKDEYKSLLESTKQSRLNSLPDIVQFAYITGARFGEITRLERKDVNFNQCTATLTNTKNGEDRTIPLADEVIEILKRYPFGDVFFNINYTFMYEEFEKAKNRAGIQDFRFHDLRACAITNMLLNGMDISSVSAISGHKTWSQLKKYTRIKATDLVGPVNSVMLRIKG